ncbi:hypothetical protein OOD56_004558 [Escherichia albertii]|nr:hypothetical protein [Escherichia coli]EHR9417719.1 hypothetical protein [Escherichia coli]EKB4282573.1 hypothetical protein [Escherichia albertii]
MDSVGKAEQEGLVRFRYIWLKVRQWYVRRHPKKGKRWIRNKYFTNIGMRDWFFTPYNP